MVTVRELKDQARKHNQKQCIRLSQRKSALQAALAAASGSSSAPAPAPQNQKKKKNKKKRIVPTLISTSAGSSPGGNMSSLLTGGGGPGNSVGQKNFKKYSATAGSPLVLLRVALFSWAHYWAKIFETSPIDCILRA